MGCALAYPFPTRGQPRGSRFCSLLTAHCPRSCPQCLRLPRRQAGVGTWPARSLWFPQAGTQVSPPSPAQPAAATIENQGRELVGLWGGAFSPLYGQPALQTQPPCTEILREQQGTWRPSRVAGGPDTSLPSWGVHWSPGCSTSDTAPRSHTWDGSRDGPRMGPLHLLGETR